MKESIEQVKAELLYTNNALLHALQTTRDDKLNWSPSPTARTPIHQGIHCAVSITGIQMMLQEQPRLIGEFGKQTTDPETENAGLNGPIAYPFASPADMDVAFRAFEKGYSTREQVRELLEQTTAEYVRWLDTLTPEKFAGTIHSYFGPIPMSFGITLAARHTQTHIAQIEYIQTIYGDMDRHG